MTQYTKQSLRAHILELLRTQKEEDRLIKSQHIADKLFDLPEIKDSQIIFMYASFDGEVETLPIIQRALQLNKQVALPKSMTKLKEITPRLISDVSSVMVGPYGIREPLEDAKPVATNMIDAVLVPGVAFDQQNNRLGRGKGYYDRFLSTIPKSVPTIGLAFDFQIIDALPDLESHDFPVTKIITN